MTDDGNFRFLHLDMIKHFGVSETNLRHDPTRLKKYLKYNGILD